MSIDSRCAVGAHPVGHQPREHGHAQRAGHDRALEAKLLRAHGIGEAPLRVFGRTARLKVDVFEDLRARGEPLVLDLVADVEVLEVWLAHSPTCRWTTVWSA